ncbi:MAG TPA: lytic transglycosylase domain-containing protein [Xanthobacteraceae bacterium]|nr:lytic transglycosylase domain-containing protein [Xanthobacteraceae bacterium]
MQGIRLSILLAACGILACGVLMTGASAQTSASGTSTKGVSGVPLPAVRPGDKNAKSGARAETKTRARVAEKKDKKTEKTEAGKKETKGAEKEAKKELKKEPKKEPKTSSASAATSAIKRSEKSGEKPGAKITEKRDVKTSATPAAKLAAEKAAAHKPRPAIRGSLTTGTTSVVPVAAAPGALPLRRPPVPQPPMLPMAAATTTSTPPMDISAVKQAIDLVAKNRTDDATSIEGTISDPLARKLVEWLILRSDSGTTDFSRYVNFIAANPSWPGIALLRRRAEGVLWEERVDPQTVISFFRSEPPHTVKGHFALARALMSQGDSAGAAATLRDTWRNDGFSADLEAQARATFAGLITPEDDAVRMDARLYVDDDDAGLRAAQHLNSTAMAVAKARAAVINQTGNAKALLDAVPEAARHDPGYMFSRIQLLRREDKIKDAAQWLLAAPRDPEKIINPDPWWVERRLVARKLLDLDEPKMAYDVVNSAAPPNSENFRAEQHFTAGWIALRFLREPGIAMAHFARVADGATNPITLARSYYWQARAAEALGRQQDARSLFEAAAHYPTAYYGQLARARLGLDEVELRDPPPPSPERHMLELARVFEILYATDNRDLIATMAADLGDKATDVGALVTLADIAARHNDARAMLLIGKLALGRGYPMERFAFPNFGVPEYRPIGPPVEPCVVYSIVRQESAFNPRVVSSANAIGLMQVTPAAGRDTAKRFGVAFDQRRLMNDVAYNAQLGSAELGNEIASWRGSYILAFAAYNAGPRRAKEWIEQYGDPRDPKVDPIDWIERIPISETRNYVERVVENMQVYRAIIENNPKLMIDADLRRGG